MSLSGILRITASLALCIPGLVLAQEDAAPPAAVLNTGDTAWMLVSCALVLLMLPGLAMFYGGLTRTRNVLGTMMHSFAAMGIMGVQWVVFGFALAYGTSAIIPGVLGWDSDYFLLNGVLPSTLWDGTNVPIYLFAMFQGMFAIITPALIAGAIAERVKFGAYCLLILLWGFVVYEPLAYMVWNTEGMLFKDGAIDFAGGTVVHISSGVAGLVAAIVLGPRIGYPFRSMKPNNLTMTLIGAGLLWIGWFGFNGGSAVSAGEGAVLALDGYPDLRGGRSSGLDRDGNGTSRQGLEPRHRVGYPGRPGRHHAGGGQRDPGLGPGIRIRRSRSLLPYGTAQGQAGLRRYPRRLRHSWRRRDVRRLAGRIGRNGRRWMVPVPDSDQGRGHRHRAVGRRDRRSRLVDRSNDRAPRFGRRAAGRPGPLPARRGRLRSDSSVVD